MNFVMIWILKITLKRCLTDDPKQRKKGCLSICFCMRQKLLGCIVCTQCMRWHRPIAADVARSTYAFVCVCLCVVTRVSCAKTVERIEMPFGGWLVSSRNYVLGGVQILHSKGHMWENGEYVPAQRTRRRNAFPGARSEMTAMRPIFTLIWTLVSVILTLCE